MHKYLAQRGDYITMHFFRTMNAKLPYIQVEVIFELYITLIEIVLYCFYLPLLILFITCFFIILFSLCEFCISCGQEHQTFLSVGSKVNLLVHSCRSRCCWSRYWSQIVGPGVVDVLVGDSDGDAVVAFNKPSSVFNSGSLVLAIERDPSAQPCRLPSSAISLLPYHTLTLLPKGRRK